MQLGDIPAHRTVVLEDCDGVGKTSFAERLACDHGFAIIHSGRTPDGVDLAAPAAVLRARLLVRDGTAAASLADIEPLLAAYEQVVTTLAAYLPVVRLET